MAITSVSYPSNILITSPANENFTIQALVPVEAGQGWKVELFEIAQPIEPHYHKAQRQFVIGVEGELQVFCGDKDQLILREGEMICIDPHTMHSFIPVGKAKFIAIDLPGFTFPEDVFYDQPTATAEKWSAVKTDRLPPLEEKYFGAGFQAGDYAVYELVNGDATNQKWSAALLEISDSPKHYHRIEKERFIVVQGTLDIEVDGEHRILEAGESILLTPGQVHQLKSGGKDPVRVLCLNFPAFHPSDMYCVE